MTPVTGLLDHSARTFPAAPAISYLGSHVIYRRLAQQVDRLGNALEDLGVIPGGRVLLLLPWIPQLVRGLCACWRIGAEPVVLDGRSGPHAGRSDQSWRRQLPETTRRVLAATTPSAAIVLDRAYERLIASRMMSSLPPTAVTGLLSDLPPIRRRARALQLREPGLRLPSTAPVVTLAAIEQAAAPIATQARLDVSTAPAFTTFDGRDLVTLTHHDIVIRAQQVRMGIPHLAAGRDRVSVPASPDGPAGVAVGLAVSLLAAAALVLPRPDGRGETPVGIPAAAGILTTANRAAR